jgi:hypothetical protein
MNSHKPPKAVQSAACSGLEMRRKFNRGGTAVGVARARNLCNGDNIPIGTIARMVSYFARHEIDKQAEGFRRGEKGFPSAGKIAFLLWGDEAGKRWADSIWKRYKESNKNLSQILDKIQDIFDD